MSETVIVIGLLLSFSVGTLVGAWIMFCDWIKDTVRRGHAEYYLDENNQRQWRWKP